jgi:hypothetical protein
VARQAHCNEPDKAQPLISGTDWSTEYGSSFVQIPDVGRTYGRRMYALFARMTPNAGFCSS